jgi:hypothetical protein
MLKEDVLMSFEALLLGYNPLMVFQNFSGLPRLSLSTDW